MSLTNQAGKSIHGMLYKGLLFLSLGFNVAAHVLLKQTMKFTTFDGGESLHQKLIVLGLNPFLWVTIFCYGFGFAAYAIALSKVELSLAYPVTSVGSIILIVLFSYLIHSEGLDASKLAGIVLCIVGIVLIFR